MGFEESGHSSVRSNEKLRNRLRKQFFPKTFSSPSIHENSDDLDPEAREALNVRMQLAKLSRARRIKREYFFYLLVVIIGVMVLIVLFGNN